jgi:hypothetical protein
MEQFETFQAFHREGVEGPYSESFEGARGHPPASGMRCRPVADLCRFRMGTGPLEDHVGSQLPLADPASIFIYGEAQPFPVAQPDLWTSSHCTASSKLSTGFVQRRSVGSR